MANLGRPNQVLYFGDLGWTLGSKIILIEILIVYLVNLDQIPVRLPCIPLGYLAPFNFLTQCTIATDGQTDHAGNTINLELGHKPQW